jgi:hypothetical protein
MTETYNCIAWACGRDDVWCWPDEYGQYFWPIPRRECSINAFVELFASIGYSPCINASTENGFLKIALYVKAGQITHAARQLPTGKWTSKLGQYIDIEHDFSEVLDGPEYGTASIFLKKELN